MDEKSVKDPQAEGQLSGQEPLSAGDPPPEGQILPVDQGQAPPAGRKARPPASRTRRILEFLGGFLGWYLLTLAIYGRKFDAESLMICAGVFFLVNITLLIVLLLKWRMVGWGMLSALALNMVVSLALGLIQNALCFIPFYQNP